LLTRHLTTAYDLSPEDYRARWGRPADYPLVAPNFARQRRKLAKQIGLGTRARRKESGPAAACRGIGPQGWPAMGKRRRRH
jgi:predicted transcriptional regulator